MPTRRLPRIAWHRESRRWLPAVPAVSAIPRDHDAGLASSSVVAATAGAAGASSAGTAGLVAGSLSTGASSAGSTDGHRYAKYKPADTMIPSTSARMNGSQITPRS